MRLSAGVVLPCKTQNRTQHTRYRSATGAISGGGGRSVWGRIYTAVEMIEARDGENEQGQVGCTPKCRYRAHVLNIGPAYVSFAVVVVVVCTAGSAQPLW